MSSGNVWLLRFSSLSLLFAFLPRAPLFALPGAGSVLPPRAGAAKSLFLRLLRSSSTGVRKSILNASFFSRFGREAAASVASAEGNMGELSSKEVSERTYFDV